MVVPYIQVIAFAVVFCRRDCEGFIHEQLVAGVVLLRHQIYYNVVFPVFPCGIVDYLYPAESFRAEVFTYVSSFSMLSTSILMLVDPMYDTASDTRS